MESHQVHVRVVPKCRCQLIVRGAIFILVVMIVFLTGVTGRQPELKPGQPELKPGQPIEIGGNVSALIQILDSVGVASFYYAYGKVKVAATDRSSAKNITLFSTFCNKVLLESVWLPTRNFSLKASKGSLLPFNYYGGDTPVYSAGGKGSFISISISAEATNYDGPILWCGVRIFRLTDFSLYNNFVNSTCNNVTISNLSQHEFKCIPVGPSGLPLSSLITFELVEHGYYRLAMLAELSVSINSSVTGQMFHYNTSFLNPVFCDLNTNCTLNIDSYRHLADVTAVSASVCNLALADEYTTVVITPVQLYRDTNVLPAAVVIGVVITIIMIIQVLILLILLLFLCRRRKHAGKM